MPLYRTCNFLYCNIIVTYYKLLTISFQMSGIVPRKVYWYKKCAIINNVKDALIYILQRIATWNFYCLALYSYMIYT